MPLRTSRTDVRFPALSANRGHGTKTMRRILSQGGPRVSFGSAREVRDIARHVGLRCASPVQLKNDYCRQEVTERQGTRLTILALCGRMRVVEHPPLGDPQRWSYAIYGPRCQHERPEASLSRPAQAVSRG